MEPYNENRLSHQEPIKGISEWQEWNEWETWEEHEVSRGTEMAAIARDLTNKLTPEKRKDLLERAMKVING